MFQGYTDYRVNAGYPAGSGSKYGSSASADVEEAERNNGRSVRDSRLEEAIQQCERAVKELDERVAALV